MSLVICKQCGRNLDPIQSLTCPFCHKYWKNIPNFDQITIKDSFGISAEKLFFQFETLKKFLLDKNYPKKDERQLAFNSFLRLTLWASAKIKILFPAFNHLPSELMNTIHTTKSQDVKNMLMSYEMFDRASILSTFMFQVEVLLKSILKEISVTDLPRGYRNAANSIINTVSDISEPDYKRSLLIVPAYMRNSLHNSGIHKDVYLKTSISNYKFEFVKGQKINARWDYVITAVNGLIDVLIEIVNLPEIDNIKFLDTYY